MDNVLFELFTKQIVYFLLRSTPAKVILMIEYNLNKICNPNIWFYLDLRLRRHKSIE